MYTHEDHQGLPAQRAGSDESLLLSSEETLAIEEDFRFSEPDTGEEVLWVKAESVLDVAAACGVIDAVENR